MSDHQFQTGSERTTANRKASRRQFLTAVATAAAGGVLSACGSATPQVEGKAVKETVAVKTDEPVPVIQTQLVTTQVEVQVTAVPPADPSGEVVFWGYDDHPLDLAATGFVEKYPQIKWVSPHPADWGTQFKTALAAGEGCPDLYWTEATDAQVWGCQDLLVDLTEHLAGEQDNYHPLKWNETVLPTNQHNIGWPGDIGINGWYYRADLLDQLGYGDIDFQDWTYDDFVRMATDLAKQKKYTFLFPATGGYAVTNIFNLRLHQVGGSLVSADDQTITANNDQGVEAMAIVKQLWDSGGGLDAEWLAAPYFAAMRTDELIGQFAAAWETGFWESNLTPQEGGLGSWRVAKMPKGPSIKYRTGISGGAQLVCPKCATNTDNAILYMKYALASLEGAALYGAWGIIPSYRPYLRSPLFQRDKTALFGNWPHNQFWAEQEQELSLEYYRLAGWGEVNAALAQVIPDILKGNLGIEDGLNKAVEIATPDFERVRCVKA